MSDRNTADNWRLEESGDTTSRWKLEETEQNQISQWELQEEYSEEAGWQPVNYTREPQRQSGSWVLPSLVGLALIAVVAYGAWIGITRLQPNMIGQILGQGDLFTPVPTVANSVAATTPDSTAATAAPVTVIPPTVIAEPTIPPTEAPTVAPTPVQVEERFVTISAQYGVNARPNPSTEGDALQILEQGGEYLVVDSTAEWLQVALPTGKLAWISSDPQYVTVRSETMDVTRANQFRKQVDAPLLEGGAMADLPPATTSITATTTPIADAPVPTVGATQIATGGAPITGTVNITAGLNARGTPDTNGALISLLPSQTLLTLTGRTADNEWLRTTLSETITAWVFADFIEVGGDINAIPVVDGAEIGTTEPVTTTATTIEPTPAVAETPAATLTEATASVNTLLGAAIRAAPAATADALGTAVYENVLTVTGRSADDLWLQVDMAGTAGWVLVSAVDLSVDLESLPVVNP